MATESQILNYLLAWEIGDRHDMKPEEVLSKARSYYGSPVKSEGNIISEQDVNEIYAIYPTRDPSNGNKPLEKGEGAKRIIRQLLTKHSAEDVKSALKRQLETKRESGQWLKNFTTALNNLDFCDVQSPQEQTLFHEI